MSFPTFSSDPADYPDVANELVKLGLTPVLIVIGGSHATNTVHAKSDLDIWGIYLEDSPEELSMGTDVKAAVLGTSDWTQLVCFSLSKVKQEIVEPINDPPRRIWHRENFLAYPRIFDSIHADEFRKELLEIPALTVAQYYLEAGDWHVTFFDTDRMMKRAIRLFLTGARLLEMEDLVVDYQVLMEWAGNPTIAKARERLQAEIDKL